MDGNEHTDDHSSSPLVSKRSSKLRTASLRPWSRQRVHRHRSANLRFMLENFQACSSVVQIEATSIFLSLAPMSQPRLLIVLTFGGYGVNVMLFVNDPLLKGFVLDRQLSSDVSE